ncbi:Centromere protein S [Lachnellula occidentalis]|uniref:Centromere protein S n=1 Tax=Lachnellula occidentalis TaxID=215460 RepID=A0A8H8UED7_9HELO|nr:Centromere protein S [Lachnellula occidentalis]
MADAMDEDLRERLKASLWFSIGKIVDEETLRLDTTATPQFIGAMTEMVWSQIGRTTVTTDDVLLITRRNEALCGIMRDFVEKEQHAAQKGKSKAVKVKGRAKK